MELLLVVALTAATVLVGLLVTEPGREPWHHRTPDREGARWKTRRAGRRPARLR